ncbi:hypothetical protein [Arenimonas donghaensis]|uniref:hypothetical protein n=1 Tax=Arenimonas donghaensis TaxID=375061 RepID=UPI001267C3A4|nr:hypothetical protein [Arenimonas donghaensis]
MAVAKKKPAKKAAQKKASRDFIAIKRAIPKRPKGYTNAPGSKVLIPAGSVVEPGKLMRGLTKAKDEIDALIQEIIDTANTEYEIHELEFAASFSADGKFMGIGVGGAATITFRIRPCS